MCFHMENERMFDLMSDGRAKAEWSFENGLCKMTLKAAGKTASFAEILETDRMLSEEKREIVCAARAFFRCASEICGMSPEWGTIDGVKPVRLYLNLIQSGLCGYDILKNNYLVSDTKARLVRDVGDLEHAISDTIEENSYNLYISIPFCPTRCKYCSFISQNVNMSLLVPQYLEVLCEEIAETAKILEGRKLNTVYIGGGTPTVLDESQLERLLYRINECFDITGKEFTLEAGRPDTVTEGKMSTALKYGVNRVSINTQTTNDEVLVKIGRRHTAKQYFDAFKIARDTGIPIINTDLIAGFPDDTFEKSLADVISLSPENLTVHTLCVKNSAGMRDEGFVRREKGLSSLINDSYGICHNNGYFPYYLYKQKNAVSGLENVGYSRKGCECIYNICMMSEINSTVALGAGASTKIVTKGKVTDRTESFFDCKYPKEYIENREKAAAKAAFLRGTLQ